MQIPSVTDPILTGDARLSPEVSERVLSIEERLANLTRDHAVLIESLEINRAPQEGWLSVFNGYIGVLVVAFLITLIVTPICRRLAISNGVVDAPKDPRKIHKYPIAYLGGLGVYLGIMGGIFFSYAAVAMGEGAGLLKFHDGAAIDALTGLPLGVAPWIIAGLTVIMVIGLLDDVTDLSPRVKIGGQLLAAAFLAYGDIGVNLAQGVLTPTLGALLNNPDLTWTFEFGGTIPLIGDALTVDIIYWTGTAVIAIFVLGACNASNLIDGLDGLLSGVTAIATFGLLAIALMMVFQENARGDQDATRIILSMAVCGACLGFLPHNFNPATIFLGDCGSLLLGFATIVIVLTLGDTGRTDLVIAGLIVYSIPIIDTILAIVRRKMAGKKMSDPDSDHLHHMLKRALGVKGAVLTLYCVGICFAVLGVLVAASGARMAYTLALLFSAFLAVYSIKIAQIKQIQEHAARKLGLTSAAMGLMVPADGTGETGSGSTSETPSAENGSPAQAPTAEGHSDAAAEGTPAKA